MCHSPSINGGPIWASFPHPQSPHRVPHRWGVHTEAPGVWQAQHIGLFHQQPLSTHTDRELAVSVGTSGRSWAHFCLCSRWTHLPGLFLLKLHTSTLWSFLLHRDSWDRWLHSSRILGWAPYPWKPGSFVGQKRGRPMGGLLSPPGPCSGRSRSAPTSVFSASGSALS